MNSVRGKTEDIDDSLADLDLRPTEELLDVLVSSQKQAIIAVEKASSAITKAVSLAVERLATSEGRLVLAGAGASGRLAVQDGAELWPTYGWPHERLVLSMAGGHEALLESVEGVEDDRADAEQQVAEAAVQRNDVVVALAASGRSPWTCAWVEAARSKGALTIGISNNDKTPLLAAADVPVWLDSGPEVLAGSTRMAAGTAQKVALNLFSTGLMIRLNRTYGNLMVDMAAVNKKLDDRRWRMLKTVLPEISEEQGREALASADGWVKLAAVMAQGISRPNAEELLQKHRGSLRSTLESMRDATP